VLIATASLILVLGLIGMFTDWSSNTHQSAGAESGRRSVQAIQPLAHVEPNQIRPTFGVRGSTHTSVDQYGYVQSRVGCVSDLSASTLDLAFSSRVGPLIGWDNAHVYPLGEDRWLWLVHDSYLDYTWEAEGLHHDGPQIQNLAILQEGRCFTLVHRGSPGRRINFETGNETVLDNRDPARFFWPLGGELDDNTLRVFWSETEASNPNVSFGNGISRHPVAIWIAEYDAKTLQRLSFEQAPDSGVFPSYGFAVASDDTHSYLFGNSNLLNLDREGGLDSGPHSATQMYLARVPRGQLGDHPEYRTGDGWSLRASDAVPISERFWAENTMQPRFIDGTWISVAKVDGFWGDDIVIDVAENPWGPWTTVEQFAYEERPNDVEMNSYQPIILPWSGRDNGLQIVISENTPYWDQAVANPALYRPRVFELEWPTRSTSSSPAVGAAVLRAS
jgi:hypothetical protein